MSIKITSLIAGLLFLLIKVNVISTMSLEIFYLSSPSLAASNSIRGLIAHILTLSIPLFLFTVGFTYKPNK